MPTHDEDGYAIVYEVCNALYGLPPGQYCTVTVLCIETMHRRIRFIQAHVPSHATYSSAVPPGHATVVRYLPHHRGGRAGESPYLSPSHM